MKTELRDLKNAGRKAAMLLGLTEDEALDERNKASEVWERRTRDLADEAWDEPDPRASNAASAFYFWHAAWDYTWSGREVEE